MAKKILIVDDEQDIVELLKYNLEKEGYKCYTANNGNEALVKARDKKPDLILLDIMMPEMDGIETCRQIREDDGLRDVFVAFLTARAEEYSEIAGFDVGADDYITKPVKPRVLVSRVKALLKRKKEELQKDELLVGDIHIDRGTFEVSVRGEQLVLPKKEFELLYLLATKPGQVFTREKILNKVWGYEVDVVDLSLIHISEPTSPY